MEAREEAQRRLLSLGDNLHVEDDRYFSRRFLFPDDRVCDGNILSVVWAASV